MQVNFYSGKWGLGGGFLVVFFVVVCGVGGGVSTEVKNSWTWRSFLKFDLEEKKYILPTGGRKWGKECVDANKITSSDTAFFHHTKMFNYIPVMIITTTLRILANYKLISSNFHICRWN